jgi:hypothetical protein
MHGKTNILPLFLGQGWHSYDEHESFCDDPELIF